MFPPNLTTQQKRNILARTKITNVLEFFRHIHHAPTFHGADSTAHLLPLFLRRTYRSILQHSLRSQLRLQLPLWQECLFSLTFLHLFPCRSNSLMFFFPLFCKHHAILTGLLSTRITIQRPPAFAFHRALQLLERMIYYQVVERRRFLTFLERFGFSNLGAMHCVALL